MGDRMGTRGRSGSVDTSIEDRARFDNYYIDQYSRFLDLVIAVKTINSLFMSKQSY